MIFTIAVHGAPYASQAHFHALRYCAALVDANHKVARVFFYHEGVMAALNSQVAPQDEADIHSQWVTFAQQHNIELSVCIANGLKRGVLSEAESQRYDKPAATLTQPFELVGLGQLIDAIASSERYVEFPA